MSMLTGLILIKEMVRSKRSFSFLTGHTGAGGVGAETSHADKQGQLASFDEGDEKAII